MRPFILRYVTQRASQSITSRFYLRHYNKWRKLYDISELALCPSVSMYGLIPGDIISGHIAFNGFYELELSREIAGLSRDGAVFVDVGANMGYFSLLWAGLNPHGRVIAFEAAPRNIKLITHNIKQNGFGNCITLVPKAAGHKSGIVHFDTGPTDQTGWGGISNVASTSNVEVPLVRLDEELQALRIDVLKIDVEGADTWVLYGCEKLLKKRQISRIYFEQNSSRMAALGFAKDDARDFLRSTGYTCMPFGKSGDEWVAFPDDQPLKQRSKSVL